MWVLLTRRVRLWLLVSIGGPVLAWVLSRAGQALEARNGPSRLIRLLQTTSNRLRKKKAAETEALNQR